MNPLLATSSPMVMALIEVPLNSFRYHFRRLRWQEAARLSPFAQTAIEYSTKYCGLTYIALFLHLARPAFQRAGPQATNSRLPNSHWISVTSHWPSFKSTLGMIRPRASAIRDIASPPVHPCQRRTLGHRRANPAPRCHRHGPHRRRSPAAPTPSSPAVANSQPSRPTSRLFPSRRAQAVNQRQPITTTATRLELARGEVSPALAVGRSTMPSL